MEKIWAVYIIQSIAKPERVYVGSATDYYGRIKMHRSLLKRNKHHSPILQYHFNKYGEDDLVYEILESRDYVDVNHLLAREQSWYYRFKYNDKLIPYFNVNKIAGTTLGYRHTAESLKKISDASKAMKRDHPSLETREIWSKQRKGRIPWNKGISPSEEAREKQRQKMKGFKHTEEAKEKIRESMLGRPSVGKGEKRPLSKRLQPL